MTRRSDDGADSAGPDDVRAVRPRDAVIGISIYLAILIAAGLLFHLSSKLG